MNKYIVLLFTLLAFTFTMTSCDDETEPGGTAVEKMAGDWWVEVTLNGESMGHYKIFTYNTAANVPTEMWLEDGGNFWNFKVRINSDVNNMSFATSDFVDNKAYESKVKIMNGKVTLNGAKSPSGMPVDGIHLEVSFDDDENPANVYILDGFRKTGFPEDDFK